MKKQLVTIVVVLVVVAVAVLGTLYLRNSQEAARQNEVAAKNEDRSDVDDGTISTTSKEGTFVTYSETALDSTSGTRLLFFHAPWCPQCRAIEADIKSSEIPSETTIFKVDYDSNQALRQEYGVTLQTTFILLDEDNELADKYVAYNTPTFKSVKDNLLKK